MRGRGLNQAGLVHEGMGIKPGWACICEGRGLNQIGPAHEGRGLNHVVPVNEVKGIKPNRDCT